MIAQLRDPAVLIHVVVRAETVLGLGDTPARRAIESLWHRARDDERRMTAKVNSRWPFDLILPRDGGRPGALTVLAAAQHAEPRLLRQIMVYQQRDIIGVSILEAVQGGGSRPWREFDLGWLNDWKAPTDEVVGTHVIYLGLIRALAEDRLPALLCLLPEQPKHFKVWRPTPEQLVAELPSAGVSRHLFAVAAQKHGRLQSQWFTNPPHPGLPRFIRYLEHSARLRDQSRRLNAALGPIRDTTATVGRDVTALHLALEAKGPVLDRILRAEPLMTKVESGRRRVIAYLADISSMATTVRLARQNLTEVLGAENVPDNDQELSRWTLEQLQAEEAYLESVRLKAAEVGGQAASAVAGSLQRGLDRVLLAQASLLSAVALAFTAAQTLEYKPPIPDRTFGPLIALVAAIALALPITIVRRWRGGEPDREWFVVDVACAALTGAALAWLIETWCTGSLPWLAFGCALGGGSLAAALTWWRVSRLTRAAAATTSAADPGVPARRTARGMTKPRSAETAGKDSSSNSSSTPPA